LHRVGRAALLPESEIFPGNISPEEVRSKYGSRIHEVDSPIVQEYLAIARDRNTDQVNFRKALYHIGSFMGTKFKETFPVREYEVETPLGVKARAIKILNAENVLIISVLRAAIPFVEGLYEAFPKARTGIISAYRGPPPEFKIECNYNKIPNITQKDEVLVADPMLATGNTAIAVASEILKKGRPRSLTFMSVIAAGYGIDRVLREYAESEVWVAAIDPYLNRRGYIVPGLGDAGDRCFGASEEHEIR
jgi:uracil phosphoribosyltransferase